MDAFSRRFLLLAAALLWSNALTAESLDELLARNSAARGGYHSWQAVRSARLTGVMTLSDGAQAPVVLEFKRPGKVRVEFSLQGLTGIQAFDGQQGWQVMPFAGEPHPRRMNAEERSAIAATADFDGPLIDYRAKGYRLEWIGTVPVADRSAHWLRLLGTGGEVIDVYLDTLTYLEIKQTVSATRGGRQVVVHTRLSDYRPIADLVVPHVLEITFEGLPASQRLDLNQVEIDVEIDDARFLLSADSTEDASQR